MTISQTAPGKAAADPFASVDALVEGLASVGYIASRRIATALYMAANLQKPILVEGSAGVGKTELALSTARLIDDNQENGWAATAAWRHRLAPHADLILEAQHVDSKRAARRLIGEDSKQPQSVLQSAIRLSF